MAACGSMGLWCSMGMRYSIAIPETTTPIRAKNGVGRNGAPNGTSVINLLQNIKTTDTALFDNNLTELTLSPAPTNSPTDPVSRYAAAFIPIVRTAAATDSAIGPRRFGSDIRVL